MFFLLFSRLPPLHMLALFYKTMSLNCYSEKESRLLNYWVLLNVLISFYFAAMLAYKAHSLQKEIFRPLGNFTPCIWGDYFASLSFDHSVSEAYAKEIEILKERVRGMLLDDSINSIDKMSLINTIHRTGLSYHFDNEIRSLLGNFFTNYELEDDKEHDLYTISMHFQLFRQHGFKMPSDIFSKFMDKSSGKFKESLASNVNGMLSLYEASQLRTHREDVLEEALAFTKPHLERVAAQQIHPLANQVAQYLEQSFNRGIPRVEARVYMSFYEEDNSHNNFILRLAKLDYNLLQVMHQKELKNLFRWSKDLNLPSESPYSRDRVLESYLFGFAFFFEPCYSLAREIVAKTLIVGTRMNDFYDSFATFEELQLFIDAIGRWDASSIYQLPDYMKFVYRTLLNLYDELHVEFDKFGRSYAVNYSKEAMKALGRAYHLKAEWHENNYIPTYDEYIKVFATGLDLIISSGFVGMFDCVNEETIKWLQGQPKLLELGETIGRLYNDITDREFDQRGGRAASAIECYKEENGFSEEEAIEEVRRRITEAWKDLNEEYLKPSDVAPLRVREVFYNFCRSIDVIYKYDNGFNDPKCLKDVNTSLFVDPMPL